MSSMKAGVASGETKSTLFVTELLKHGFEKCDRLLVDGEELKFSVAVAMRPVFQSWPQSQRDHDSDIGNVDMLESCNPLNIGNFGPKVLNRVFGVQRLRKDGTITFKVLQCHSTIFRVNVAVY